MGVGPAIFESAGKRTDHFVPGVYSRSNNVTSPSGVSAGNMVILGEANGGEPGKLLSFGSLSDAKDVLLGGELVKAIGYAFNASNAYIPQRVFAMRVNKGTQATLNLQKSGTNVLKLTAWDWGVQTNQLKAWVRTGTASGSKKIIVVYKDDSITIDNIIKPSFSVEYIGTGTDPKVTITTTGIKLSATEDDAEADVCEADFSDYPTLAELIARINDSGYYIATVIDTSTNAKTSELDTCSNVDCTSETIFYSNYQALINALEGISYISKVENLQTTTRELPDNTDNYVYFAGGTSGNPVTLSDWSDALKVIESEDIQIIATPSTDSSVHSLISSHCTTMSSTVNRHERTCILGASINADDESILTAARGFNNTLVSYVGDTAIANNPLTGETETISGAMLGVMLAGMESAMSPSEPLTFKALNVLDFVKHRTITNMETLIKGGVLVCNPNPENVAEFICIRAITTFQGNNDLISCERSMVREDLFMNRDLRNAFANGIGRPNEASTSAIIQTLKDRAREWGTNGYVIPSGTDYVWNIKVRFSGDKVYLSFSRYLTAPRNFVFITATNQIYESEIEL